MAVAAVATGQFPSGAGFARTGTGQETPPGTAPQDSSIAFIVSFHSRGAGQGELTAYLGSQPVSVIKCSSERLRSGTERGEQLVSPSGETRSSAVEFRRSLHGTLFVENPAPGVGMEHVQEKSDRAEEATGDIEGITADCSLASSSQDERCLPLSVADERLAQRLRIATRLLLQGLKLAARVGEDSPQGQLSGIGVGVHAQGVAGLGADLELAGLALLPYAVHPVQISVDPVDAVAVDGQPATTVHPRSPASRLGDLHRPAGQLGRQQPQSSGIQRWPVVQAQVVVGIRAMHTSRPTTAQAHTNDPADPCQPIRDLHQAIHEPQSAEADHRPRPIYPAPTPRVFPLAAEVQRSALANKTAEPTPTASAADPSCNCDPAAG
ncbi:hypothetical protein M2167_006364 [Streptomyces sp. SPB4]|nr:hypothetical protein [Streptomyces sp. SPB4]